VQPRPVEAQIQLGNFMTTVVHIYGTGVIGYSNITEIKI